MLLYLERSRNSTNVEAEQTSNSSN